MASYTPPSENLPIFDNSVFTTTTTSSGFTYDELLALFLSYPVAQGEQTIASLLSNSIDTNLPTTAFNFLSSITTGQINIGTGSTGTIKIGASTGTSVHCGSIDCTGTTINNASGPYVGALGFGTTQTTGIMSIASGVRTGTGALNINANASSNNTVNIGNTLVTTNVTGIGTIKANTFDVVNNSTDVSLFGTSTTGNIAIGGAQSSGTLSLGVLAGRTGTVSIGNTSCATNLTGIGTVKANLFDVVGSGTNTTLFGTTTTGQCDMLVSQTSGILNIGTSGTRSGAINIGSGASSTSTISIGNGSASVVLGGTVNTTTIEPATATSVLNIGAGQTSGILNIGTSNSRSGAINIGSAAAGGTITIGDNLTTTNITGLGTIKANVLDVVSSSTNATLFATTTTGSITVGGAQTSGAMNLGTLASRTGTISIGNTSCAVNITGTGTIKANAFDATAAGTSTTIYNTTTTGTIKLGANQTTGVIEIGTLATRSGALYINSTTGSTASIYIGADATTLILDSATITAGSASTATINIGTNNTAGSVNITGLGTIKGNSFDVVSATAGGNLTIVPTITTRNIVIGGGQTTGTLAIGNSSTRTGDINIGTNATGGSVNLGSVSSNVVIYGASNFISPVGLPTATTTPSAIQLGYTSSASTGPSTAITTATGLLAVTNTGIGIYILTFDVNVDTCTSGVGTTLTFTFPVTGSCTVTQVSSTLGGITNGQSTGASYTGVLKCTTAVNSVTLTMACGVGSAIARSYKSTIIKIA